VRTRRRTLLPGLALLLVLVALLAVRAGVILGPQLPGEAEQKADLIHEGMSFEQVVAVAKSRYAVPRPAPEGGPGYMEFGWHYDDYSVLYVSFGSLEVGPLRVVAFRTTPPVGPLVRLRLSLWGE